MTAQLIMSAIALFVPYFSKRVPWFILWALAAVGLVLLGVYICAEQSTGWDGLACLVIGALVAPVVIAGIVTGIVRVVSSGGGARPANLQSVIIGAAISYGIGFLVILGLIYWAE